MPARVRIPHRIVSGVAVPVQALRVAGIGHDGVRLDEAGGCVWECGGVGVWGCGPWLCGWEGAGGGGLRVGVGDNDSKTGPRAQEPRVHSFKMLPEMYGSLK